MLKNLLTSLYEYEINVNREIQKQFDFAEPILRIINEYLDPIYILNLWIPLVGGFNHKLLVQLVSSLGLINALTSVIKWCFPEYRPVWWIKENSFNYKYNFIDIKIDPFSCDTSAGFPSAHATTFAAFTFVVIWRILNACFSSFDFMHYDKHISIYTSVSLLSTFLWFTRLYYLYEFLHQCVIGFFFAVVSLHILNRSAARLLNVGKVKALTAVFGFGSIPIIAYFAMLHGDVDPFWSVRMAFKWCADPLHLKHESSPVFILCRDFGYLMGVALSCPLAKNYENTATNYSKRLPILILMAIVNALARSYTPKQYGRFLFVSYEFLRNSLHSLMLLTILPKFGNK